MGIAERGRVRADGGSLGRLDRPQPNQRGAISTARNRCSAGTGRVDRLGDDLYPSHPASDAGADLEDQVVEQDAAQLDLSDQRARCLPGRRPAVAM